LYGLPCAASRAGFEPVLDALIEEKEKTRLCAGSDERNALLSEYA